MGCRISNLSVWGRLHLITPVWFPAVAGLLLGLGFWFLYHIIRVLNNKTTQISPTRGSSIELGAAVTVQLAPRLGLPVSTTQCLTGTALGVAMMNLDMGAVDWRQIAWIFLGWVLTLPMAGLIAGLIVLMALDAPLFLCHFYRMARNVVKRGDCTT